MDWQTVYERSWRANREPVLRGEHGIDYPPREGGRWPLSYVLRPDTDCLEQFARLSSELGEVIGPNCWAHDEDALHVTVRALETHRAVVPHDDALLAAYRDSLAEAASVVGPVRLRFTGITLGSMGVLACGEPLDGMAEELREQAAKALSRRDAGEYEAHFVRDMWHLSLAHFTGPLADPEALVDWVADRRTLDLGTMTADRLELIRAYHDGRTIRVVTIAEAPLG